MMRVAEDSQNAPAGVAQVGQAGKDNRLQPGVAGETRVRAGQTIPHAPGDHLVRAAALVPP